MSNRGAHLSPPMQQTSNLELVLPGTCGPNHEASCVPIHTAAICGIHTSVTSVTRLRWLVSQQPNTGLCMLCGSCVTATCGPRSFSLAQRQCLTLDPAPPLPVDKAQHSRTCRHQRCALVCPRQPSACSGGQEARRKPGLTQCRKRIPHITAPSHVVALLCDLMGSCCLLQGGGSGLQEPRQSERDGCGNRA